jgi:predicted HAD superfamily Cof-like phosphohydrolase
MVACGQTLTGDSTDQFALYHELVMEEGTELATALHELLRHTRHEPTEPDQQFVTDLLHRSANVVDGIIDTIVVLTGLGYSMGIDMEKAWREVHGTNMAKIDPETGKVIRRESDGKVLKPEGWVPPDLVKVVMESWNKNAEVLNG